MTEQRLKVRGTDGRVYGRTVARNIVIQASKSILLQCNKLNYGLIFSSFQGFAMAEPVPVVLIAQLLGAALCRADPGAVAIRVQADQSKDREGARHSRAAPSPGTSRRGDRAAAQTCCTALRRDWHFSTSRESDLSPQSGPKPTLMESLPPIALYERRAGARVRPAVL